MIIERKAYGRLVKWKNSSGGSKAILIKGARRVGKSFLAERFAENEYATHILIDFSDPVPGTLDVFRRYGYGHTLDEFFNMLSLLYSTPLHPRKSLFIFDEVQKYPRARELIKQLVADGRYDYVETGSLISIRKNTKDILIPSEEDEMILRPLDFEEFLRAVGDEVTYEFLRDSFRGRRPLGRLLRTFNERLRLYMLVGGMPQPVVSYVETKNYDAVEKAKRGIIKLYRDDIAKYAEGYVAEATAVFDAIPSQLSHHDKKIKFSSLSRGGRYSRYLDALDWTGESLTANLCHGLDDPAYFRGLSVRPDKVKCYMADTGLLLTLAAGGDYLNSDLYRDFVLGKMSVNNGMFTENAVAQMLAAGGNPLRFYETVDRTDGSGKKYEVDFLLRRGGKTVPVEVKSGRTGRHPSLDWFSSKFRKETSKPVILTKGDFRETDDYLYVPLAMTEFL